MKKISGQTHHIAFRNLLLFPPKRKLNLEQRYITIVQWVRGWHTYAKQNHPRNGGQKQFHLLLLFCFVSFFLRRGEGGWVLLLCCCLNGLFCFFLFFVLVVVVFHRHTRANPDQRYYFTGQPKGCLLKSYRITSIIGK